MTGSWQGLVDETVRLKAQVERLAGERDDARELLAVESKRRHEAETALLHLHSVVLCGLPHAEALEGAGALLRRAAR